MELIIQGLTQSFSELHFDHGYRAFLAGCGYRKLQVCTIVLGFAGVAGLSQEGFQKALQ